MTPDQEERLLRQSAETHAAVQTIATKVEQHEVILDGTPENGDKPGLRTRVVVAEKDIESLKADRDKTRKRQWKLAAIAVTGVFGLLCSWVKSMVGW